MDIYRSFGLLGHEAFRRFDASPMQRGITARDLRCLYLTTIGARDRRLQLKFREVRFRKQTAMILATVQTERLEAEPSAEENIILPSLSGLVLANGVSQVQPTKKSPPRSANNVAITIPSADNHFLVFFFSPCRTLFLNFFAHS